MTDMVQPTVKTVKARKGHGQRDNEILYGWQVYYKVARSTARKWFSNYIPTYEDLDQAAALAATVVQARLGDEARLAEVMPIVGQELREQAKAYGMRKTTRYVPGGKGKRVSIALNREVSFSTLEGAANDRASDGRREGTLTEYLETRMMIVGVGEWTRKHARFLWDLGR